MTDIRPVAIEVRDVHKAFRIPVHRVDSLKERATRPFAPREYRALEALRGVSFDVHEGEFFGVVGRNGSGKSSLLKILASIYRADAGSIRVAGRLAPFIELGVGFNPELSAPENVVLNGVMMGLTRREARSRLDAVLDFAELRDFRELKLKNYSSGMMVRLAFAVMIQAEADIMLVDEVLAVGDAAFAQKCMDVFREKRDAGRTIVLVTHDMSAVLNLCDRALLLHDGDVVHLGDPETTAMRYYRLNFANRSSGSGVTGDGDGDGSGERGEVFGEDAVVDLHARALEAWLENDAGERIENVERDEPITLNVLIEARTDLEGPVFGLHFVNSDGVTVFGVHKALTLADDEPDRMAAGQRVRIKGRIENSLLQGRYSVQCWISRKRQEGVAMQSLPLFSFVVYGTKIGYGLVSVREDLRAVPESSARAHA